MVHVGLLVALTWGVSWHNQPDNATEAELWQAIPQLAAPKLVEQPEQPQEPEPQAQPSPPPAPPKPIDNTQAIREAQLATAKLKKLEEEQLERERQAQILRENERLKKEKAERERAEREKAEKEAKEKALKDKLERERLEKEKLEKDKKAKEKVDAAKADKDAQRKKDDDKKVEALRQEQLKRMQGIAGATGSPNSSGTALRSGGPSPSYAGRLKGRVRPNIIYPEQTASDNPSAEVLVRLSPDGTIVSRKLTKPSGNAAWDAAVLKAIDKTERFPKDTDGSVPSEIVFTFTPNEQ
jgi:colicin import membrane protein